MGRVKMAPGDSVTTRLRGFVVVGIATVLGLAGCVDPNSQLATTPPADDFVVETAPLTDDDVEDQDGGRDDADGEGDESHPGRSVRKTHELTLGVLPEQKAWDWPDCPEQQLRPEPWRNG